MANLAQSAEELLHKKTILAMLLFLGSEGVFFAVLISAYVFYAGATKSAPNAHSELDPLKTGFYTACLLSSSLTVWFAEKAGRKGKKGIVPWLAVTMALGLVFLYGEMTEYSHMLKENITVSRNLFGSTFYTVTGFHALHVGIGLVLLGTMVAIVLGREFGKAQHTALTCISYYWHFVDIVWVAVFSVIYLWSTR